MLVSEYTFKFYINANHAIYLGGVLGQNHPHTWEISLSTFKVRDGFVQFNDIEKLAERYFARYQDRNINTVAPFDKTNPTLENLTEHFKNEVGSLLAENGWLLARIEVSETPTRSYIIDLSDDIADEIRKAESEAESRKRMDTTVQEEIDRLLRT